MGKTQEISRNLGGNRLGSGNKNNIDLHAYNRSTHDLTKTWRSSMNVGTLVPFFSQVGLNGDTFSINLDNITRTLPSIGPLYGSYKLQLDVFECPIRLYNGLLHNNMNGIGLNMAAVKFPKIELTAVIKDRHFFNEDLNKSQISKSSLINYLGLNGLGDCAFGTHSITDRVQLKREFNALPLLAYYDIYKNYYANKQEEKGVFICASPKEEINKAKTTGFWNAIDGETNYNLRIEDTGTSIWMYPKDNNGADVRQSLAFVTRITIREWTEPVNINEIQVRLQDIQTSTSTVHYLYELGTITKDNNGDIVCNLNTNYAGHSELNVIRYRVPKEYVLKDNGLTLKTFDLKEIDNMRMKILQNTGLNNVFKVNSLTNETLWTKLCDTDATGTTLFKYPQHGIAIKTYQSDLYNNWLQTEWIDGLNGINKITAIDTSSGSFEIDALILGKKIYNMLNRVAVSGGSYEDWQEAVYSVKAIRKAETPVYRGGLSAEIMFSEIVSNAATEDDPLGTLAGKGGEHNKRGGNIEISCDEPCIIMGIASITPRVDYSQGNSWILTELDSMDDLHKPALDGIGFQDLLEERMAYWGTVYNPEEDVWTKHAAGKIPAWLNYMTDVNETHGDFAEEDKCMFMTLNRRYEFYDQQEGGLPKYGIKDLTTYVDPRKYNYIFADDSLEAQNFWIQIGIGITARRVMSAKVIPFL